MVPQWSDASHPKSTPKCFTAALHNVLVTGLPVPPQKDKACLSREPGLVTKNEGGGGGRCRNLQPLFLNSFYHPTVLGSREARLQSEELRGLGNLECSPPSQTLTPPHSQGPAPPLTGDEVGVVECCGRRAGESSRLPEKQPGHCPDGHRWGSQDAGERAPQKSTRG